jgi:hypothetical protein
MYVRTLLTYDHMLFGSAIVVPLDHLIVVTPVDDLCYLNILHLLCWMSVLSHCFHTILSPR